ncbi:putative ATP-dependent helicase YwqA [Talaromyces islandicus]|uniref:Putative ATP-dependent helicase YwqA n=1 Tax=Talaromyces islandicus TaxID=28573 RepID=A0A0U1LJN4_TALIS|nr:putative ATP-dependent helicase YwqA [Talaromyces islandicus]
MSWLTWIGSVLLAKSRPAAAISWQNEVNVSICNWAQLRANVVRDTIYLDGGDIWWQIGLSDGTYGSPQSNNEDGGSMYSLALGIAFNQQTNMTGLLQAMAKNGGTSTANVNPNYEDGVMLANDDEFILYGGLARLTNSENPPPSDVILGYEVYEYSTNIPNWKSGFIQKNTDNDVTRYVTNGAGVSAPSENMGFYFSGMRGPGWGSIEGGDESANTTADSLITVNMTTMRLETWQNMSLPTSVAPRANAELAWIPVSESGVLVAIGGVINPEILTADRNLTVEQAKESNKTSPSFMSEISVYDIASQTWFLQNTTGDIPPQLTMFCSVVAPAADRSSFNIYIYGGYDGVSAESPPSDDVYILSIPSFTWIKAYSGQYSHGRSGHKCLQVYPDQMFILGGIFKNDPTICLEGGFLQVFNLNTLQFQEIYSPQNWSNYSVPAAVTSRIGGTENGGATKISPSSWNNNKLSNIFSTAYTKPINTYYPYSLVVSNSTKPGTETTFSVSSMPPWVKAIFGVFTGLGCIVLGLAAWYLYRRFQRCKQSNITNNIIRSSVQKSSPDRSSTTEETNTNSSTLAMTPITGVSSISREKETETNNTQISVGTTMSQADSAPIFELDSRTRKWVELPAEECEVKRPSSTGRNHRDLKISLPNSMPAVSESVQNTPTKMQEKGSDEKGSTPIWVSTPTFSQGHPVRSTMGSVSISDISEASEHGHEPPSTVASFVQYYDPRARAQRNSEGSAEDRND